MPLVSLSERQMEKGVGVKEKGPMIEIQHYFKFHLRIPMPVARGPLGNPLTSMQGPKTLCGVGAGT